MQQITSLIPRLMLTALLFAPAAWADTINYTIDPSHTQVDFRWNHLGFSNPAASIDQVTGTLRWDADNPTRSTVEVVMPTSSIRTRVPALDTDFQSAKFFDAAKYPEITFRSTRVERFGLGNRYRVHGDLTLHGITRQVILDTLLNASAPHPMSGALAIGFDATTTILRSAYGLDVALPMVSDEIDVRITVEAIESKGTLPAPGE